MQVTLLLWAITAVTGLQPDALQPLSDELIRYVNEESHAKWKAKQSSRFQTEADIRPLLGAIVEPDHLKRTRRPTVHYDLENIDFPRTFDARNRWPNCTTIGKIRDQSSCGSCWAFGATEAMSDRICISSKGRTTVELSARDLISCCSTCGRGCYGGGPGRAGDYWTRAGLVTGSSMEENLGCEPYPFPKCSRQVHGTLPPCPRQMYKTPKCVHTCQKQYNRTYSEDKFYGKSSYNIPADERQIMLELMTHGPVEAVFSLYADFVNYDSGVYHHVAGVYLGLHAIKIIGWGFEGETPYWLIANSWNEEWGEDGFFRILRGKDECGIEQEVVAGLPKI